MFPAKLVSGGLSVALVLAFALSDTLAAQEAGRITGTVTADDTMRPLDGAQVSVEGAGMGSLTNNQGRFLILNVPPGEYVLRVTSLGFGSAEQSVTLQAGGTVEVSFQLEETALALDEIVVTGTAAEVRAKEVGNSLDAVTSREFENIPVNNSQDILSGRAPGVTIMTNSGQAGAGGSIKIRGVNTVSQTASPLIYVDGVRIYNEPTRAGWGGRQSTNPLQDIAAEDIERVEVVKGAAATTLYGTEASAGVIQIFTKQGVSGDPLWTGEIGLGASQMPQFLADASGDPTDLYTKCGDLDNLYSLNIQASTSDPSWGDRVYMQDPTCPSDGTWQEAGPIQKYSLAVRGGAGDVTYYLSGNFNDQEGILPTQASKDGGFRGNFSFAPLDELTFQLNTSYTRRDTRWVADGNNATGFLLNVGRGAQNYLKGGKGDDCANVPADRICITNGYLFDQDLLTQGDHFISGFTATWNPTDGLSNRFTVGWDYLTLKNETTRPFGNLFTPDGYFWDENTRNTKVSLDYAGSFQNSFGDDINSTFSWGGQIFRDYRRWTELDVGTFAGPGRPTIDSGAEVTYRNENQVSQTSAGFFFQEMLGWQDLLFLTAGVRVDGNSAFGENFGLQVYPKVSLSYILSDYDFWPSDWFETFKLRGAVGESGRAPPPFARVRTWSAANLEGQAGFTPGDPGNDEVGPERTRELEVGFDASLIQGRLGVETTYFTARTTEALINVDLPASEGFLANRTTNVGELKNSGWEFQITTGLLRTASFDWRVRTNMSFLSAEAVDLDNDPDFDTCIYVGLLSEICEGERFPMLVGDKITNPNAFADPVIEEDAMVGPTYPTRLIGIGSTFSLGDNVTIDALLEHQGGHYLTNYTGYQNARRGAWFPCFDTQAKMIAAHRGDASALNDVTALERARCAISSSVNPGYGFGSDYWMDKADFWKLRHITLSYQLPDGLLSFARSATVTMAARNLFMRTDYSGTDPEVQDFADQTGTTVGGGEFGRRDYYQIPNPRTYMLSVRLSW